MDWMSCRGGFGPDLLSSIRVSPYNFGLNDGPIVLMIENHLTELVWKLMRRCPYVVRGLLRAGFRGGWLAKRAHP